MRRQNRSQIIGREGERWFNSILPSEWSIQRPFEDFGVDGFISIGTESNLLPLEFAVQIKSSMNFRTTNGHIVVPRISYEMLRYWLSKLVPTLLVAYDAEAKKGYCNWVQNLVTHQQLMDQEPDYYLHIDLDRQLSNNFWSVIHSEVESFHKAFFEAVEAKIEILPACKHLSTALSILCNAELIDDSDREGQIRRVTNFAWTYVIAGRELNNLVPNSVPDSYASKTLRAFRDIYFSKCSEIILDFDRLVASGNPEWIAMKRLDQCGRTRFELNAMLSDCLFKLISYA